MTYLINKKYISGAIALGLALVFVVGITGAHQAFAQSYTCGYYNGYYHTCYQYTPPTTVVIPPLYVSCYSQPLSTNTGNSVTWISSVSGGTGSYNYSWSGSNGFMGNGSSVSTIYYSPGTFSAYLTVSSGSQSQSVNCSNTVNVYGNNYYNYATPIYSNSSYYNYNYTNYSPIQVSCVPNTASANVGAPVTWTASAVGGTGYYNYSWSGTDGISGYGQSIAVNYSVPGQKIAAVTVNSNGQNVTQNCSSAVNVGGYINGVSSVNSNGGLDIGCYSDPTTTSLNQPITWTAEVTGGLAPYTYTWSGSDGLTGAAATAIKYYNTSGEKNAIVSVTSADGKTGTRACSNTVNVSRPYSSVNSNVNSTNTVAPVNSNQTSNGQSAAALFSLQNVPWGWIAILIILILFATVMYLIFNRPKI